MPVYKDKNGTWFYSFQKKDPLTGKYRHIHKRGFKTKREANQALRDAEGKTSSTATFREMAQLWEQHKQSSDLVKEKHRQHFTIRFSEYLDKPIDSLSKPILSRWRSELAEDDRFSTETKNTTITYVKSVLAFAHSIYDIETHPEVLTKLSKTDDEVMKELEKEMLVWTPQEFEQFLSCVDNELYRIFYEFLFWTGCRRGEAIALQKTEVKDHAVTFKYSQRTQKEGLKPTKVRNVRTVRLDDVAWQHLQPLLDTEGSYLFGGITGLPKTLVRKYFLEAIKASGVKPITLHSLRHSHASWLINNGVNILAVSRRLGHKDVNTTLKIYTHLLEQTDNSMMDKLNDFRK